MDALILYGQYRLLFMGDENEQFLELINFSRYKDKYRKLRSAYANIFQDISEHDLQVSFMLKKSWIIV